VPLLEKRFGLESGDIERYLVVHEDVLQSRNFETSHDDGRFIWVEKNYFIIKKCMKELLAIVDQALSQFKNLETAIPFSFTD
jgi:hypothetical protein